ncbi:MAG: recombinase family protein [Chitinophagaceae bacterium]|nr:recombinase family protein [Chitinophagaceae bacterium]
MQEKSKKQCVIYCRVSTKEQAEEGNSLITQERLCKEYAAKNGYTVATVFVEQGESAKTADRTELKKLIAFCTLKKNDIKAVIVYKIDRLSRNTDDYSQIRIMFKKYGVEIKSISEHFEDTPAGRFMENIIANVAQFDNDVRAERSIGGMKEAVREGRYVWMAPFGYSNCKLNGKTNIIPNESAVIVKEIFSVVAQEKRPVQIIRMELLKKYSNAHTKNGLSKSNFYHLLRNELYCGVIRKFGAIYKGNYEPIISEKLFYKVQAILKKKKPKTWDNHSGDFPLRKFLYHPSGKAVTGCWAKGKSKKYPYYMIHGHHFNVRKEVLETTFASWLDQFKLDITDFEKLIAYLKTSLIKFKEKAGVINSSANDKIKVLKEKQSILINKNLAGVIPDQLFAEKLKEISSEIELIFANMSLADNTNFDIEQLIDTARQILRNPSKLWMNADFEEKLYLQNFYFPHGIEIDNNGSRTQKICKLFKLKLENRMGNSHNVHHSNIKSNTVLKQLSLPWQQLIILEQEKSVTFEETIEELSRLHSIIEARKGDH